MYRIGGVDYGHLGVLGLDGFLPQLFLQGLRGLI